MAPSGDLSRLFVEQDVGIHAHFCRGLAFRLTEGVPVPLEGQARRQRAAHDRIRAGNRRAEGMHPARRVDLHPVGMGEHHAGGADGGKGASLDHHAGAHSGAGIVAAAGGYHRTFAQARGRRSLRRDAARRVAAFQQGRQQILVNVQLFQNFFRPAAVGHIQQIGAAGVAHFGGVFAGQAVAHVVLRQKDMGGLLINLRLVLAHPENLPGGKAGQGRIGARARSAVPYR